MRDDTRKSKPSGYKGIHGLDVVGKVPLFKLFRHGSKVYIQVTPEPNPKYYCLIMRRKIIPDSIVYYDCWRGYNILCILESRRYRIDQSKLFTNKGYHSNKIKKFLNREKHHMHKFNGIPRSTFGLYLKKC